MRRGGEGARERYLGRRRVSAWAGCEQLATRLRPPNRPARRFRPGNARAEGHRPAVLRTFANGCVISLLLANVALNHLEWRLGEAGHRFVRYADDFVVVCRTRRQAEQALALVEQVVTELGLTLSPEKTKIASHGKGYEFLGFLLSSRSRRMRPKPVEKFKTKIRELTTRHHNLDAKTVEKLNQVIRGTANYFATSFSTCLRHFLALDKWIRMRVRCMKLQRKSCHHNYKLRMTYFQKLGLLKLSDFARADM